MPNPVVGFLLFGIAFAIFADGGIKDFSARFGWPPRCRKTLKVFAWLFFIISPIVLYQVTLPPPNNTPLIKSELNRYYAEIGVIFRDSIPKDNPQALREYFAYCKWWLTDRADWIETNMGVGAKAKFLDSIGTERRIYPGSVNEDHIEMRNILARVKDNLATLIESNSWAKR